ncbi:S-layer homology domain-containing protein [Cohnella silvisoli]|uniref:S-layer homology domain-containing protein n=1 Tax=Cohnella silvisoli TaxID=2873699 RepID=A0ABV1L1X8_9BACL|nr:S-layer homology domain-containing protein [Cohnella silvisoli]MCD9025962.1 S-layer homology domain-containing protein [Cohnella silvisoli]
MMKKWILSVLAAILMLVVVSLPVYAEESVNSAAAIKFKDVPVSHWAYASIMNAAGKGYVKGFPDGTFRPNESVTAAQFISMLILSLTEKDESGVVNWSKDTLDRIPEHVKSKMFYGVQYKFTQGSPWYINYVNIAKDFSIINNEFEGRYIEPLTRERTVGIVMGVDNYLVGGIYNSYANLAVSKLKDFTKIEEYYRADVGGGMIRGIMTSFPDGTWKPKKEITRAEAITIIERINNKSIRNPYMPVMTGVPYSDVPFYGYTDLQRLVFTNAEMKKVYDTLNSTLEEFQGSYLSNSGTLDYYKDEEAKEKAIRKLFYFEDFTDPEQYYDMGINFMGNVYFVVINGKSDSLDRTSETLDKFLSLIFSSNDAAAVRKLINDNISTANRTLNIKKTIGKREVLISSSGRNILSVAISAYQDK